jgi:hypothetical protein
LHREVGDLRSGPLPRLLPLWAIVRTAATQDLPEHTTGRQQVEGPGGGCGRRGARASGRRPRHGSAQPPRPAAARGFQKVSS